MNHGEKVEKDIELVSEPEEPVGSLPDGCPGEDEDGDHETVETDPGDPGHGLEEPVAHIRSDTRRKEYFSGHTLEVVSRLRAQVIEVDHVSDGVDDREEQGSDGTDLMKLKMRIKRNVLMKRDLLHLGDQVLADGEK